MQLTGMITVTNISPCLFCFPKVFLICYVQSEQSLEKENSYYKSTELYLFMHILSPELLSNDQKICEKDYCQKIFAVDVEESLTISRCHG